MRLVCVVLIFGANLKFKINQKIPVGGNGLWSSEIKDVLITRLQQKYVSESGHGYFDAYFTKKSWNPYKCGLIYTDRTFIQELRKTLVVLGFSEKVVKHLTYTEQGMQGDNYVSLEANAAFCKEFTRIAS